MQDLAEPHELNEPARPRPRLELGPPDGVSRLAHPRFNVRDPLAHERVGPVANVGPVPAGRTAGGGDVRLVRSRLAVVFLVVAGGGFAAQVALDFAVSRSLDLPGGRRCAGGQNFYRPPCPQQSTLVWTWAVFLVLSLVIFIPTLQWRRTLIADFSDRPPGRGRWWLHSKHPANVLVPLATFVALAVRFGPIGGDRPYAAYGIDPSPVDRLLIAVPNMAVVFPAALAMISIFDTNDIASRATLAFLPASRLQADRLDALRRLLDRFLLVLGVLLTGWMFVNAANADFLSTVAEIEARAATASADPFAAEFTAGKTIVMSGGVVSAALALLYVPAALAVDRLARVMLRSKTKDLDWHKDYDAAKMLHERYTQELGLGQSVKDRFISGLPIAAPLTGALFSVLVLG